MLSPEDSMSAILSVISIEMKRVMSLLIKTNRLANSWIKMESQPMREVTSPIPLLVMLSTISTVTKCLIRRNSTIRVSFQLLSTLKSTTSTLIKSVVILNMIKTVSQLSRKTLRVLSSIREDLK